MDESGNKVCVNFPKGEHGKEGPNIGETELSKPLEVNMVESLSSMVLVKGNSSSESTIIFMASM